jgi:hypothetical protein
MEDDDDDDEYEDNDDKRKEKYDKLFTCFISRESISINTSDLGNKNKNKNKISNDDNDDNDDDDDIVKKEKKKEIIIYNDENNKNKNKNKNNDINKQILEHSLSDEEIEKIRNKHKKCYIRKICEYIQKDNEDDRKELQDCMNKIVECLKKDQILPIDPEGKCQKDVERVDELISVLTEEITEENFSDNLILKRLWFWLAIGVLSPSFRSFLCPVNSQPLVDVAKFTDFVDEKKNTDFFNEIDIYNACRINEVQFIVNCYKLWVDTNPDLNIDSYKGTNALQISDELLIVSGKHSQIADKNRASSMYLLPAPEPKTKTSHKSTEKDEKKKKTNTTTMTTTITTKNKNKNKKTLTTISDP